MYEGLINKKLIPHKQTSLTHILGTNFTENQSDPYLSHILLKNMRWSTGTSLITNKLLNPYKLIELNIPSVEPG